MAPRGGAQRRNESRQIFELGKRGRKTGVELKETGELDEHGMAPTGGIFSSPERTARTPEGANETLGEQDMELDSASGPGPSTVLNANKSGRLQLPRSRSPMKTNLQSPAMKNPHLGPSSPTRGSIIHETDNTVTRRLDFKNIRLNGTRLNGSRDTTTNGTSAETDEEEEEAILQAPADVTTEDASVHQLEDVGDSLNLELAEDVNEAPTVPTITKPRRGRPPKNKAPKSTASEPVQDVVEEDGEAEEAEAPRQRRPQRKGGDADSQREPPETEANSSKRRRSLRHSLNSVDLEEDEEDDDDRHVKRQRINAPQGRKGESQAPPSKAPPTRGKRGRKPATEDVDTSLLAVQRGPPLPKSKGLVSLRSDSSGMTTTRSGRHSYQPVQYWKGERAVWEEDDHADIADKDRLFVVPTIKEIVRVPDQDTRKNARKARGRNRTKAKSAADSEDDNGEEAIEEWERDPGSIVGEVAVWEPDHEFNPPGFHEEVALAEEQLAISSNAIFTSDIHDATFRFAKTMSLSFMGSGIVDLPPGSEKRPKNSRKMQMVFFVFYGKVLVTINQTEFRISTGGQWFVPRGNYYSIKNDYDHAARIFFAQACEVTARPEQDGELNETLRM